MDALNTTFEALIFREDLKANGVGMMPLWRGILYCCIYFYFVLHTSMIRGIGRNLMKWPRNAEQM